MKRGKAEAEDRRLTRLWNNICVFVVIWACLSGLFFLAARPFSPSPSLLNQYQFLYLALSALVVGMVVVCGVLPGTRFAAPESEQVLDQERVKQTWATIEERQIKLREYQAALAKPTEEPLDPDPHPGGGASVQGRG